MNQESKAINVHLEKRENKDYLVFGFEEVAEVCLNDDESQNNLKSIFVKLLTEITKYPVELQFLENPDFPLCPCGFWGFCYHGVIIEFLVFLAYFFSHS